MALKKVVLDLETHPAFAETTADFVFFFLKCKYATPMEGLHA